MKKILNIIMLTCFITLGSYGVTYAQQAPSKDAPKVKAASPEKKKTQLCERCKKNTVKNIIECVKISCDEI